MALINMLSYKITLPLQTRSLSRCLFLSPARHIITGLTRVRGHDHAERVYSAQQARCTTPFLKPLELQMDGKANSNDTIEQLQIKGEILYSQFRLLCTNNELSTCTCSTDPCSIPAVHSAEGAFPTALQSGAHHLQRFAPFHLVSLHML
jgi:hypothetical protein